MGSGQLFIRVNDGVGNFNFADSMDVPTESASVVVGDMDGDSDLDIVA